jgi:hypothetical protein
MGTLPNEVDDLKRQIIRHQILFDYYSVPRLPANCAYQCGNGFCSLFSVVETTRLLVFVPKLGLGHSLATSPYVK